MNNQVENSCSGNGLNQNTVISGIENNEETIDSIRQRADLGDAEAQVEIGIKYFEGKSVETDYAEALKYFKLSADQGNSRGQFLLGGMYLKGVGVTQNYEDAFKYFKLSADQGNSESQFCVGALYKAGKGITKDYKEAIKYFKLSADQGHKDAKKALNELELKVASSLENSKTKENDIKENNDSIEQNTPKKQKATSVDERISQLQEEYKYNPTAARVEIFLRDNPFIIVIFAVGIIAYIYYSYNEPQNTKSAPQVVVSQSSSTDNNSPQKIVTQATSTNNNMASTELDGIKSLIRAGNYTEASNRLKVLIEQGNKEAEQLLFGTACMLIVGKNYEGKTIETNLPEAQKYLKFLADKGNKEAQDFLKARNDFELGLEKITNNIIELETIKGLVKDGNYLEASPRLRVLVEQGDKDAQQILFAIAYCWISGKGINKENIKPNYSEATNCLRFLADKGNKEMQTQAISFLFIHGLSLCTGSNLFKKEGEIIEKNIPEGVKLIKLAHSYNTPDVQKMMKGIYEDADKGNHDCKEIVTALKVDSLINDANNNPEAIKGMFSVGISLILGKKIFEKGEIIEKNISEGVIIIKIVNSYNIPEIQEIMKKIYSSAENGDPDAQEIVRALNNESKTIEEPKGYANYDMDNNKVYIELKSNIGDYALGAANVVKDFYTNYLNNNCSLDNWEANKNLMPLTRQIFLMLKHTDFDYLDYDFIVQGQDYGNIWKINTVKVNRDTALVGVENSFNGEGPRNIKILCKYVNGKWFIDDIEESKKLFYSFLNSNLTLGVVDSYDLSIFSKKYNQRNLPFYDIKNRIIPLKFYSLDYYQIDSSNNLGNKIDSNLSDSEWYVKSESVITFNFLNKIRKGESKYLAYIVLGEPAEDSSNKLFYSPNNYISYDNNNKITSWTGFEDLKDFFDDGTGLNNQNIGYVNAKSGINLRKEPNTKSEKVLGLPFNCQVMILNPNGPQATFEKITSNWYLITDGTKVGWAFGGFIRKEN